MEYICSPMKQTKASFSRIEWNQSISSEGFRNFNTFFSEDIGHSSFLGDEKKRYGIIRKEVWNNLKVRKKMRPAY